jgi:hypothetical protein
VRESRLDWNLRRVVKYLDRIYPHIGVHCPYFALEVVLFSAAVLQNTDTDALSLFTRCPRDFVKDISLNMENNNLWADGKYDCSKWFSNGQIIDDDRFCEEATAAEGSFWFPAAKTEGSVDPLSSGPGRPCHLLWEGLVCDRNLEPTPFVIYFAHNPKQGPGYRIYSEDDILGAGGIHALELELRQESYWFVRIGSIDGVERPSGVGFDGKTLSDLIGEEGNCHILRQNIGCRHPAFEGDDLELFIFDSIFCSLETYLDSWKRRHGDFVKLYGIKELGITRGRLWSLAASLRSMGRVHDLVSLTVLKYEFRAPLIPASVDGILGKSTLLRDADHDIFGELLFSKSTGDQHVVGELPLTIPIQLRWSTNEESVSTDVMPFFRARRHQPPSLSNLLVSQFYRKGEMSSRSLPCHGLCNDWQGKGPVEHSLGPDRNSGNILWVDGPTSP